MMEGILDAAQLGDSDFEDDEMDEVILLHIFNNDPVGNRAELYGRFTLDNVSNTEARNWFRFEKAHIPRLATALGLPDTITTENNITLNSVDGLCILLRRFAYPNRLVDLESIFVYSYKGLSSIINTVMMVICNNKSHLLENLGNVPWLNEARLRAYSEAIMEKGAPMNNCWGFIDGTIRPICRPTENQQEYYSGYKKVHCVKYQSVVCPDGIVISLKGAYPGRRHDAGMLRESGLYEELLHHTTFPNQNYVIYGDKGYGLRELLLRPYTELEIVGHPERQIFNTTMSGLRIAVEWGFQKIVQEFAFVDFKKNQKLLLQEIGTMYKTCMILTNCHTCLYGSQTGTYFNIEPPQLEQYLGN